MQLSVAQIDTYLTDRAAKGFSAILFNAIESDYSSRTPHYLNVAGNAPFTTMSNFGGTPVDAYWQVVDHIVAGCKSRNMLCIINFAYFGATGEIGWDGVIDASTDAQLFNYGAWAANRYASQGNVVLCQGGDDPGTVTRRNRQWQFVAGWRSVDPNVLVTGHAAEGSAAYTYWSGYTGFNVNASYPGQNVDYVWNWLATEYARSGPIPVLMLEAGYENEFGFPTVQMVRSFAYTPILAGACGMFYGNNPVWNFEGNALTSYSGTWQTNLNSAGAREMARVMPFYAAYQWWKLAPRTDASLVSSALGTGTARVCPALASDGSFAIIWKNNASSITVVMSALTKASVRARWFDPTAGTYTDIAGSPFASTGPRNFSHPGNNSQGATDWLLVLD